MISPLPSITCEGFTKVDARNFRGISSLLTMDEGVMVSAAGEGDGSGVEREVQIDAQMVANLVNSLRNVFLQVDKLAEQVPDEWRRSETVRNGLNNYAILREALEQFLTFVESPVGRLSMKFVNRFLKNISSLADVGGNVIIASIFLYVGQELLDIREEEFEPAVWRIKTCKEHVENLLPAIESNVRDASNLLREIVDMKSKNPLDEGLARKLWLFDRAVSDAKFNIADCKDRLRTADEKIDETLNKIKVKFMLHTVIRGVALGIGAVIVFSLFKSGRMNGLFATTLGITMGTALALTPVPRYRKLWKDLNQYREMNADLNKQVESIERRLDRDVSERRALN